jgi:2,5-diketo-D-gluconate reductase A
MAPPSKRARTDDGAASSASAAAAAPASAIPMIGFGTHTLKGTAATRLTAQALAAGYACVDTASIYSNEAEVGAALQKWKGAAPYVITKLWRSKHGDPKKITAEVRSSVRKLGKVDLWLLHWPHPGYPLALPGVVARQCPSSGEWPVAKWRELRAVTWREMAKARQAGTVGAVGLSNVGARLLAEMTGDTGEVPALVQNELHPLNYLASKPWIDWCTKRGVVVQAYVYYYYYYYYYY